MAVLALVVTVAVAQPGKPGLMQDAHALVFDHQAITRTVENIADGVRTETTSSDPALVNVLRRHPREMVAHFEAGGMVRGWDPVFRELAAFSLIHRKVGLHPGERNGGCSPQGDGARPSLPEVAVRA